MNDYILIAQANKGIKTMNVKGNEYATVDERVNAYRKVYPKGTIVTDIVSLENGVVVMKSTVYDEEKNILATGYASEREGSSLVNKTNYIENCETSSVGRALGMCGFGIDTGIRSAEEIENALLKQEQDNEELKELSIKYVNLRTRLTDLGCDFRDPSTNKWIIKNAKVPTQDNRYLNAAQMQKLLDCYSQMIEKKEKELVQDQEGESNGHTEESQG